MGILSRAICKLSVIVPVYNVERYIERCMTSLLQFTGEDMEILCIDDGSTDNSGCECEKFALQDNRIKVIHQIRRGPLLARKAGLAIAKGEYISFVDSDDWIDSRLFGDFIELMDSNPNIDLCIGGAIREYPDGSKIPMFEECSPRLFDGDEALQEMVTGKVFFWYLWGKVYRRTVFEGFSADEGVMTCEDLDLLWQLFQSGRVQKVWYSPKYKYHYYFNTCGMTEGNERIKKYKSDLYVFEKILKSSNKDNMKVMSLIRKRALQSIYSILRECYFLNSQSENINTYREKAISILNKMSIDEKKRNMEAQRVERMVYDEKYAGEFFENVFVSIKKAISEAENYPKKYIFGTGIVSQYVTAMVREVGEFDGFVISDNRPSTITFDGQMVYHLSDLSRKEEKVLILAVNKKNQREIMEKLNVDGNTTVVIPNIPEDF